jgi:predicted heme/steroid binding protein/uncharacterized membrane protein
LVQITTDNGKDVLVYMSKTCIFFIFLFSILIFSVSHATEESAETTGTDCEACHIDPLGGGDLTKFGEGFFVSINPSVARDRTSKNTISKAIQLIAGYIHMITAFMWFGTILYVHLVLKPAYASKGLPRWEVRVGFISMGLMAITGSVLTYYKVPSFELLVSSKFGILLLIKISIFTVMVISALFAVLVIGPRLKKKKALPLSDSGDLTLQELIGFDGEDGRPAYIAYKGKIYDVGKSKLWKNGSHMKRHQSGTDLTDVISQAPHKEDKILAMSEVGQLSEEKVRPPAEIHKKVFYFMAYMNLGFVFVIVLILALWRWY